MAAFVARRLLFLPLLWVAVTMAVFAMVATLSPYQRLALYVHADPSTMATKTGPAEMRRLIAQYHLDDPFLAQYRHWLKGVLQGNLGWSQTSQQPVAQALRSRLPATLELALVAILPMILVAVWLGTLAATQRGRWLDTSLRLLSVASLSAPQFVVGIVLLMLLYGGTGWFPPGRLSPNLEAFVLSADFVRYTGLNTVDAVLNRSPEVFLDALQHLVLPAFTLAVTGCAGLLRLTRGAMLEALGQDYVTTARAKGVREPRVIGHHARRNAMIPITTVAVGMIVGLLSSGVVFIEQVFNYPGLGVWTLQATRVFDVPAVIGVVLLGATLFVVGNLVADLLYAILDPRIRY